MVTRFLGMLLVVFGLFMLLVGGISFLDRDKLVDVGSIEVHRTEREHLRFSPLLGGAAIVAGAILLLAAPRRHGTIG